LARYYTLTPEDLRVINRRRRGSNRVGFAVQLCMLRFPGRAITDLPGIPARVLALIAQQVGVPPTSFVAYGQRLPTIYEHLDEIRTVFAIATMIGAPCARWRACCCRRRWRPRPNILAMNCNSSKESHPTAIFRALRHVTNRAKPQGDDTIVPHHNAICFPLVRFVTGLLSPGSAMQLPDST
jgi:hypothetical protein